MKFAFNRNKLMAMTGYCAGFDPFSHAPMQAPQAPQQQQQGGQAPVTMPVASSVIPGATTGRSYNPAEAPGFEQTQQAMGGASPLDKYNKMLDNTKNNGKPEGGEQSPQQQPQQEQMLDLLNLGYGDFLNSGKQVQKSFTSGIDSAKVQSALSGNVEDFMAILQQVSLNTFAAASYGSSKLAGNYANQRLSGFEKGLDDRFQQFDQSRATRSVNELGMAKGVDFNSPALVGMRDMAVDMFKKTYPEASRDEIAKMAMDYLQDAATHISGNSAATQQSQQQGQGGERNFADLFGM